MMLSQIKTNHTKPAKISQILMKLSQDLQIDVVFNKTKTTLNLLQNSQNKSDLDETFTGSSDGCCLKPDQNNTKSSLKQSKQVGS